MTFPFHWDVTGHITLAAGISRSLKTHLWPISCAMVKAEPRPMSSLMLQLLSGSHIPATEAKPGHTHTTGKHSKHSVKDME